MTASTGVGHRTVPIPLTQETIDRFWSLVDKQPGGCWIWQGTVRVGPRGPNDRYGQLKIGKQTFKAHRVAYTIAYGQMPFGYVTDHVQAKGCTSTLCVKPTHLEAVTHAENVRRGRAHYGDGTCRQGHPMKGDNVLVSRQGQRRCRTCKQLADQRLYLRHLGREHELDLSELAS